MVPPSPQVFVSAVDYLSRYFGTTKPKVRTRCETVCPWAGECYYMACYMPWADQINVKTGQEMGFVGAHEFGHALDERGLIKYQGDTENPAEATEDWYRKNMHEFTCGSCGKPLFVTDDTPLGTFIKCRNCGALSITTPESLY